MATSHVHLLPSQNIDKWARWVTCSPCRVSSKLTRCVCVCVCSFLWWDLPSELTHTCFVSWSEWKFTSPNYPRVRIYTMPFTYTIAIKVFFMASQVYKSFPKHFSVFMFCVMFTKTENAHFLSLSQKTDLKKQQTNRKQHKHSEISCRPSVTGNLARKSDTVFRGPRPFNIANLGNSWWKRCFYLYTV